MLMVLFNFLLLQVAKCFALFHPHRAVTFTTPQRGEHSPSGGELGPSRLTPSHSTLEVWQRDCLRGITLQTQPLPPMLVSRTLKSVLNTKNAYSNSSDKIHGCEIRSKHCEYHKTKQRHLPHVVLCLISELILKNSHSDTHLYTSGSITLYIPRVYTNIVLKGDA